ncbi:TPA: peptide chain release factor 2 [Candidatus Magasanikbacteria bacterium]|nr:peptide chain release factor 2 [Candidatus Magasanikbacteria bacterium]
MQEVVKSIENLQKKLSEMYDILDIAKKQSQVLVIAEEVNKPDFWKDQENATKKSREMSDLQAEIDLWGKYDKETKDLLEIAQMDEADKDVNMREDIEKQYVVLEKNILKLEFKTLFDGKHDKESAIVAIHSGSGGTEAQDWAEMLLRMYLRYADQKGWKTTILDETKGQEAGFKSVTFQVEGNFAYGHLKSEHGTHRLVRISPFDAEKMRHTSFALVEVIPELEESEDVKIDDKDIRIDTFMAGGNGGQSVNTTYSAVRLVHIPTGITVTCQNEKSQQQNRKLAMKVLLSRLQKVQEEKDEEERLKLRGEYKSPEWGSQIRSYVLHPYHMVKDLRTRYETTDDEGVLNGELDPFVEAYLRFLKN